jgi:hypothetical protein
MERLVIEGLPQEQVAALLEVIASHFDNIPFVVVRTMNGQLGLRDPRQDTMGSNHLLDFATVSLVAGEERPFEYIVKHSDGVTRLQDASTTIALLESLVRSEHRMRQPQ